MAKFKFIPINIYKRDIGVFIGSRREFKAWVIDYYNSDGRYSGLIEYIQDTRKDTAVASFWYNELTGDGIIELPKLPKTPKEIAICSHEALHATFQILDFVSVEYVRDGSNESFTYLLEHILYNILDVSNYKTY